jgi:MFS family permease
VPDSLPREPEAAAPPNLFRLIVPPLVLPVFLAAADSTVVATALPAMAASFGEVRNLSWVVVANLIAGTVAAPAYGRLGDRFGRRRMMLVALCLFMAASALCAVASGFAFLIAARVLQGLGGGGLMTLSQALVGENVPMRRRGTFQGYLSANIVLGCTVGPVAGGFVTQAYGWHAIFIAYLPLCLVAMLLAARLPPGARGQAQAKFDLPGMALLTAFVVPLLLAVGELQRISPGSLPRLGGMTLCAAAGGAALLWQQTRSASPLLSPALLRIPAFWRADVMAACSGASLTALVTFLPIYLQTVTGATPAETGVLLIPLTGAVSCGSVLTGWMISRTGRTAIFPAIGLSVTAASLAGLAIWAPGLSRAELSWALAIGAFTQGASMITAQITVQAAAGPGQLGAAAGSVQLSRSLGSAFGAAIAGAVLFGCLALLDPGTAELFAEMVKRGPGVLDTLSEAQRTVVRGEVAAAFRGVFLSVAGFAAIIVACAATMPVRRL